MEKTKPQKTTIKIILNRNIIPIGTYTAILKSFSISCDSNLTTITLYFYITYGRHEGEKYQIDFEIKMEGNEYEKMKIVNKFLKDHTWGWFNENYDNNLSTYENPLDLVRLIGRPCKISIYHFVNLYPKILNAHYYYSKINKR